MTRIPASASTVVRSPGRARSTLALTVLAVLALAACGTGRAGAGGSQDKRADTVGAHPAAASPAPDEQVAFMNMLNTVGQSCLPDAPAGQEPDIDGEKPPAAPVESLPIEKTAPASTRPAPGLDTTPRDELNAVEQCEGRLHAERITAVLSGVADPTPARVRKVLNALGYIDERIHGLERSGATTRFFLDLRVMGGSLCLDGSAAGPRTVVEAFAAPGTGPFRPVGRKR